ncbi:MAG: phosphoribosylformylglycinamidine synthase subunit PurQ, partial [Patescibacteria group bacterium]
WPGITAAQQPRFVTNTSEIFESRFSAVSILPSPSIFFTDMAGSTLGIWVAHGEGRLHCSADMVAEIERLGLAPVRFVDDQRSVTEQYPFNPNGSPLGITALCSVDGRHLAMMPHAERLFLPWQWPYWPQSWGGLRVSPWLQMFQNAYAWCVQHS